MLLLMGTLLVGCSRNPVSGLPAQSQAEGTTSPRFEVIFEHKETRNIGGFTVIRDNRTGQEYLVVTGLNGSPAVVPLDQRPVTPNTGAMRSNFMEQELLAVPR